MGGDSSLLFELGRQVRIPVETCRTYQAKNPDKFIDEKESCHTYSPTQEIIREQFVYVKVANWGRISGVKNMKIALQDGPIVCDIHSTLNFKNWGYNRDQDTLDIYDEELPFIELNHSISVVGWQVHEGEEYWIGRNSWGRHWAYEGFFYMKMGKNTLGIESDCLWVDPEIKFPREREAIEM